MRGEPVTAALPIRAVEKPWGRDRLPEPFISIPGKRIGEVWFEPPAVFDQLLVKYIFTSENLSVQVHPSDSQTMAAGLGNQGKEECWLVIDAQPGAVLGIGFDQQLDAPAMRRAALDGSIEQLMTLHPVVRGDFFYIPANTVHAIGAGISLIEVQQNSDITYRLYDYGRPRELHLADGVAAAKGEAYALSLHQRLTECGDAQLADGPLFRLDRIGRMPDENVARRYGKRPLLLIPLTGSPAIDGERILPGSCGLASALDHIAFAEGDSGLIAQPLN